MPGNVTLSTANVPAGTCPAWFTTEFWASKVALITANLNGALNVFNYGNSTPAPADQGKPWIMLDTNGRYTRTYVYAGGIWVSPHGRPAGERTIAPASIVAAAQVWSYDGGDGSDPSTTPPTAAAGAMWEIDPDLIGLFPIGAGALPAPSATIIAVNATGGEENHQLVLNEIPPHEHEFGILAPIDFGSGSLSMRRIDVTDPPPLTTSTQEAGGSGGAAIAHNTMPPFRGVLFIRRTARLFYTP